ncbi:hypothetical protein JMF94_12980 [Desulfovibrio sp. UIB00]|uniref:hypothetical protein n=1 Tax=Desulfovibrio sp. UIB00 TaxID=2804314 RepID=UPI001F0EA856|nr:hypothetical protein [Desulfovibrio sp. UIB00]MCH5145997.1 hypothetical protein [Desulfovibrio sp. UIB00]
MCRIGVYFFFLSCFFALFCIEIFLIPTCLLAETGSSGWSWESQTTMAYVGWISTALTLGGLIASCWAAVRATNSEEAAKEAKQQTLKLSSAFTGLAKTWKIKNAIEEINRIKEVNCSEGRHGVHYLYESLRENLIEYKIDCKHFLTDAECTTIQEIVVFLRDAENLFLHDSEDQPEINIREINDKLTCYKDVIAELAQTIGNSIMEKNNE